MSKHAGMEAFVQSDKLLDSTQPIAQNAVTASVEFCEKAATVAQEGAKALTEIVDAAWTNAKILNEKTLRNASTKMGAALSAARGIAGAKSPLEIGQIQAEFIQNAVTIAGEQCKELFDLSTRATQQVLGAVQAAATKSFVSTKQS